MAAIENLKSCNDGDYSQSPDHPSAVGVQYPYDRQNDEQSPLVRHQKATGSPTIMRRLYVVFAGSK